MSPDLAPNAMPAPRDRCNAPTLYYITPDVIAGLKETALIDVLSAIITSFKAINSNEVLFDIEWSCVYLDLRINLHWQSIQYWDPSLGSVISMNCRKLANFIANVFQKRLEISFWDPSLRKFEPSWTYSLQDLIIVGDMAMSQEKIKEPRYACCETWIDTTSNQNFEAKPTDSVQNAIRAGNIARKQKETKEPMHAQCETRIDATSNSESATTRTGYSTLAEDWQRWCKDANDKVSLSLVQRFLLFPTDEDMRRRARHVVDAMLEKWHEHIDMSKDFWGQHHVVDRQMDWLNLSIILEREGCPSMQDHKEALSLLVRHLPGDWYWSEDEQSSALQFAQSL